MPHLIMNLYKQVQQTLQWICRADSRKQQYITCYTCPSCLISVITGIYICRLPPPPSLLTFPSSPKTPKLVTLGPSALQPGLGLHLVWAGRGLVQLHLRSDSDSNLKFDLSLNASSVCHTSTTQFCVPGSRWCTMKCELYSALLCSQAEHGSPLSWDSQELTHYPRLRLEYFTGVNGPFGSLAQILSTQLTLIKSPV